MGGKLDAVDKDVDYSLPDTLVAGKYMWVKNTKAGSITITAPSGGTFRDGTDTMTLPEGKYGCFANIGGTFIHARIF